MDRKAYYQLATDIGPECRACGGTIYGFVAHMDEDDATWIIRARCASHNGQVATWEQTSEPELQDIKVRLGRYTEGGR